MKSKLSLKIAVSALAIGSTMVACSPAATSYRPASASAKAPEQQAIASYAKANAEVQKGNLQDALGHAERAVELSPRDSGYRMLLADLYLKTGRFQSAETTYGDVIELDPGNPRASLSISLARIALGRTAAALGVLEELAQTAPAADVGLAFALAGQPQRAIELLEPAARTPGANGRIRQNLALAYALAGDWQKARTTAAQDVSPAELGARMQQWAAFAQPQSSFDQVASLLNVRPAEDGGQPIRLALAPPQPANAALAAAEPAPQVVSVAEPAPVEVAAVEIPPMPAPEPEPETVEETRPVYAQAVQALVAPQPAVLSASAAKVDVEARAYQAPVKRPQPVKAAIVRPATGKFVVQLGAFSSSGGVERAWASAWKRYGFADRTPLSTTVKLPHGTFHRLSVSGFDNHAEASRACRSVKAKGGVCFVRTIAGDTPTQWAGRYTGRRA